MSEHRRPHRTKRGFIQRSPGDVWWCMECGRELGRGHEEGCWVGEVRLVLHGLREAAERLGGTPV